MRIGGATGQMRIGGAVAESGRRRLTAPGRAVLVVATALAAASCSSNPDADATAAAYCDATAELEGIETLLSPESIRDPALVESAFTTFREDLRGIESQAPAEISDDLAVLGTAVDDAIAALATVGFDITRLDDESAQELSAVFERPTVASASGRIEAFDTLNCADRPEADMDRSADSGDPLPEETPIDPTEAEAFEYAELIRTTFTDDEIEATLEYAEVSNITELVASLQAGEITVEQIDFFLQRRSDGVPFTFGDDPELDILWNACEAADWAACDGLFQGAPLESLYQRFAATCGRVLEEQAGGECVDRLGS